MKQDTNKIYFEYGIAAKKINKYANIIEKAFQEYSKTNDMEKLRQRIKLYS